MKATQDGQVIVKSSDKMWSTGERNGNPLEYLCLENFMDSMKRQEVMTPGDEPPRPPQVILHLVCYWSTIINSSSKKQATGPKWE